MSDMVTLDTNILARFLPNDIPDHTERVRQLLRAASRGEFTLFVPASVFIELSYLMTRRRSIPRQPVAKALLNVLKLEGLQIQERNAIASALILWEATGRLSFTDCYHHTLTKSLGMTEIYTFDEKMDRFPGVERLKP